MNIETMRLVLCTWLACSACAVPRSNETAPDSRKAATMFIFIVSLAGQTFRGATSERLARETNSSCHRAKLSAHFSVVVS